MTAAHGRVAGGRLVWSAEATVHKGGRRTRPAPPPDPPPDHPDRDHQDEEEQR